MSKLIFAVIGIGVMQTCLGYDLFLHNKSGHEVGFKISAQCMTAHPIDHNGNIDNTIFLEHPGFTIRVGAGATVLMGNFNDRRQAFDDCSSRSSHLSIEVEDPAEINTYHSYIEIESECDFNSCYDRQINGSTKFIFENGEQIYDRRIEAKYPNHPMVLDYFPCNDYLKCNISGENT